MAKKKILICISGGGAIQLESATGVLMALDTAGVLKRAQREYRACSGGAPVAALHASGFRGSEIRQIIRHTPMRELIYRKWYARYYSAQGVFDLLESRMPSDPLTNCRVAVTRYTYDERTGYLATIDSCMADSTPATVCASMSIPCVFRPVRIGQDLYTDGGVKNLIPTPAISEVAEYDHIYIILAPEEPVKPKSSFSILNWLIGSDLKSLLSVMDREITQVYENKWDALDNVTVIRPRVPESIAGRSMLATLLEWSDDCAMIDSAFQQTMVMLQQQNEKGGSNK